VARAGLTEDRVVVEAERIADEVGLSRLTLAALAESLGVRQPSLYKHIDGMDGLQRSIAVRAKIELGEVLGRAAVGKSDDDAIRALSQAYRRWATTHPGRYSATVRAPRPGDADDEAASAAVVGVVLDVLAGYGLHGDDAIDATRALRSTLHGFVALEAGGGFGLPVDIDRSYDRLVDGLIVSLHSLAHSAR
jgi:AcrR family transcriptional regulator